MTPEKTSTLVEQGTAPAGKKRAVDLEAPSLYVNRELAWLEFNRRVLEEAQDPLTPTLEKLKFASIFSSNLDEYFMVRVGGLLRILDAGLNGIDASGRTIRQQLDEIAGKVGALVNEQYRCILEEVLPRLKKVRIVTHRIDELDKKERKRLEEYFELQDTVFTRKFIEGLLDDWKGKLVDPDLLFILGEIYQLQSEIARERRETFDRIWKPFSSEENITLFKEILLYQHKGIKSNEDLK